MQTKILAVVYVVLVAVLLLASVPVATASPQAERDFYQCVQPGTVLPPVDELKTCMVQKGHSDEETASIIRSLPDQDLFAPYTGRESGGGNDGNGGSSG
jgi:hypothetical protein